MEWHRWQGRKDVYMVTLKASARNCLSLIGAHQGAFAGG